MLILEVDGFQPTEPRESWRRTMSDDRSTTDRAGGAPTLSKPADHPGLLRSLAHRLVGDADVLPVEGPLPSFDGATGWLNSEPLTPQGLRGRVVAVDFWTYTCINWLRTAPYVKGWAAKYRDLGLTVIGVHTPEFEFEHDVDNVAARSRGFGVEYPIAIDSDYGVWQAFANHFWPALYIADAEGRLRYHHFGEGEYAMAEMVIQQLLLEAGAEGVDPDLVSVEPTGLEVAADWRTLRTPETYLAYGRSAGFASPERARFNEPHTYPVPPRLGLNEWAPSGTWTLAQHAAVATEPGGRIAFQFQARDVNLVMGPAARGTAVPFRVSLDGAAPGDARGFDVDDQGNGTLAEQRLHQLIRQTGPVTESRFEIEFLAAGAEAYCFTFG
jgi:thiol-disulfide isomerase/thioredoxin